MNHDLSQHQILDFIMGTESVFCDAGTEYLYITKINATLQEVKIFWPFFYNIKNGTNASLLTVNIMWIIVSNYLTL